MKLIKLINGSPVPYSEEAFRRDNKHTVYGAALSNRRLNAQDVYRVRTLPEPVEVGKKAVADALPTKVNGEWVLGWTLEDLSAADVFALRESMSCTPLQGKLAIGETLWAGVEAYGATATWSQRMVIENTDRWHRNSQDIQFIGHLLGVTDLEMDDLFRLAATL